LLTFHVFTDAGNWSGEIIQYPSKTHRRKNMKNYQRVRLVALVAFGLVGLLAVSGRAKASVGDVTKSDLAGTWQGTFFGFAGCGASSEVFDFTLNASGSGVATATYHTAGCGDGTAHDLPITITSLAPNGSGTADLSCGSGCAFNFHIQVSPDRSTFNLVDVSDPGNYLVGTAVHQ
jgi:hypothetical protein